MGYRLEAPDQTHAREMERRYGDSAADAAIGSFVSGATFGLSDVLASGNPLSEERIREERRLSPAASLGGSLAGALTPGGLVGLAGKGAKVVGAGVGAALGGGRAARTAGAVAAGATEGAAFGAGSGVSQAALAPGPLDIERAAITIGSNALLGGVLGGGIGLGGKLLGDAAKAAKARAQRTADAIIEPAAKVDRSAFPEFATMDLKAASAAKAAKEVALKTERAAAIADGAVARKAEEAVIKAARDSEAAAAHAEALTFKEFMGERFIATSNNQVAVRLGKAARQIRNSLDNPKAFVRDRGSRSLLDGLEKEESVLGVVLEGSDEVMAAAGAERQAAIDALMSVKPGNTVVYLTPEQAALYANWRGLKTGKGKKALAVPADDAIALRDALESGDVMPPKVQRVVDAQEMMEQNRVLQARLAELKRPLESPRLAEIDAGIERARAGLDRSPELEAIQAHIDDLRESTIGKRIAQGAGASVGGTIGWSVGGFLGAGAGGLVGKEIGEAIYMRLARKLGAGAKLNKASVARHVATFFDKAEKVVRAATPIASRIMPSVQYATRDHVAETLPNRSYTAPSSPTVEAFRQRADELDSMTERRPDGSYDVRLRAAEKIHESAMGVWALNDMLGNGVEAVTRRKLAFLASKLPRDPSPFSLHIGPSTWEPSQLELAKFARYMEACEHPGGIVERLSSVTMTPEDAEVLKSVYPALYSDVRESVMDRAAVMRATLPYGKRLMLSILLDVPVDPALTPEAQSVYQRPPAMPAPQKPARPMPTGTEQSTKAQRLASK